MIAVDRIISEGHTGQEECRLCEIRVDYYIYSSRPPHNTLLQSSRHDFCNLHSTRVPLKRPEHMSGLDVKW